MDIFTSHRSIVRLLGKYLTGHLSIEEEQELNTWIRSHDRNRELFDTVTGASFIRHFQDIHDPEKKEAAYHTFRKKLANRKRLRIIRRVSASAALFLLPLAIVLLWPSLEKDIGLRADAESQIMPGSYQARLELADGTIKQLGGSSTDTAILRQQGSTLYAGNETLRYSKDSAVTSVIKYNRLFIPRGGEYVVTLCDGTRIRLNAESELKYPTSFTENKREVYLSGEAYFEVAKDSLHPFIVRTGRACIEVLGTAFDVCAYPGDEEMLTTLVEGKVRFVSGKQQVVLHPGQQSILNQQGKMEVRKVDTRIYTAWKDGIFAFQDERLEEIMKIVARWYDVHIFWTNTSCKDITFTGKMYRYDDFSRILDMLGLASEVDFTIKDRTISISEK